MNCADCGVDHVRSVPHVPPFQAIVYAQVDMAIAGAGETEGVAAEEGVLVGVIGAVLDGVGVDENDDPGDGDGEHDEATTMPVDAHPQGHARGAEEPGGQ